MLCLKQTSLCLNNSKYKRMLSAKVVFELTIALIIDGTSPNIFRGMCTSRLLCQPPSQGAKAFFFLPYEDEPVRQEIPITAHGLFGSWEPTERGRESSCLAEFRPKLAYPPSRVSFVKAMVTFSHHSFQDKIKMLGYHLPQLFKNVLLQQHLRPFP